MLSNNHKIALVAVAILCYLNRIDISALFWTGFYSNAIQGTDDPKLQARFYFALGQWDKRVEIDEKYGFVEASLDYTYHDGQLQTEKMLDFLDFLDSIDSLIGVGKTELAMKYVEKYDATTAIEKESIQRVVDIVDYQKVLMDEKELYVQAALDILQDFKFADGIDPHIYMRYFSFLQFFQLCYLFSTWLFKRGRKLLILQMLSFFASSAYFIVYTSLPPLERFLSASTITTFGTSFLLPPIDAAHRENPSLERARQIFLKYPYNYEDLLTYQATNLMSQILWRELKRCNYPKNPDRNEIEPCISAHRVGLTIAKMIEVDETTEYFQQRDFWHQDIRMALDEEVLNISTVWPGPLHFFLESYIEPLEPDYIRNAMNHWILDILRKEHIDFSSAMFAQEQMEQFSNGAKSEL